MLEVIITAAIALLTANAPTTCNGPHVSFGPKVVINNSVRIRDCNGLLVTSGIYANCPVLVIRPNQVKIKPNSTFDNNECQKQEVKNVSN